MATNNISVNQQKGYGDQKVLDEVAKATKTAPISGAQVPDNGPGRPSTGDAPGNTPAAGNIPEEHTALFGALAMADKTRQFWQNVAVNYPSPVTQLYAERATSDFETLAQRTRQDTPFFEE